MLDQIFIVFSPKANILTPWEIVGIFLILASGMLVASVGIYGLICNFKKKT